MFKPAAPVVMTVDVWYYTDHREQWVEEDLTLIRAILTCMFRCEPGKSDPGDILVNTWKTAIPVSVTTRDFEPMTGTGFGSLNHTRYFE